VTAPADALSAQRSALDLHTQQLRTSVDLIRALGGGWSQDQARTQAQGQQSVADVKTVASKQ